MYSIWNNVLAFVEQKISPSYFSIYFKDTSLISNENGHYHISTKNAFISKQLSSKYAALIKEAIANCGETCTDLSFEVPTINKTKVKPREVTESEPTLIKKNIPTTISITKTTNLKPEYTLDNFIVGSNNDLAVAAAKSIIDTPGTRFNPFFLYGGPGLGKTHLVQAIGNALLKKSPNFKLLYTSTHDFYSDFVNAVQKGKGDEFHNKFKGLDCLIIDDFQQIIGKEKSQEEFFNIFNSLYQLGKQIIVTSDRLPSQIKTVDERLTSRLAMAGAFDFQLPKFEDKCAILRAKADFQGAEIEDEAIEYIAENINTNIRDLEGELQKIILTSEVRGITPLELINSGSATINKSSRVRPTSSKQVIDKVAKYYNLSTKEMCGKSRVAHIKTARQVAMYILKTELSMSTPKIAAEVGVKDHTTVMHGINKISQDIRLNFTLRDQIEEIKEKIYG